MELRIIEVGNYDGQSIVVLTGSVNSVKEAAKMFGQWVTLTPIKHPLPTTTSDVMGDPMAGLR